MKEILIVDDDPNVRRVIREILSAKGFSPLEASDGLQALMTFLQHKPSAVLLDLKMPGMSGIETLKELKKTDDQVPIIMVTAYGDVPTAVDAIKLGAYDFILKPPDFDRLLLTLSKAIEKHSLEREIKRLNDAVETSLELSMGTSPKIKKVIEQIKQVSVSDFSIIIQGETGTGKSYLASIIHNLSKRAKRPFVTVDIGSIPETLVESELFGYEKGAFTGAEKKRKGYLEAANGGTIFIDEVENMSSYVQSKLLRLTEEKIVYPLGSTVPSEVDVRIITATNTDINRAVKERKFREDLFCRLGEFIIHIPPLRERVEDIPLLARKFFRTASAELKKQMLEITEDALALLANYPWPGNIRELKNSIRRLVLFTTDKVIDKEEINSLLSSSPEDSEKDAMLISGRYAGVSLKELEIIAIKQTLDMTKGNKRKAAAALQIDYTTLLRKIKQYHLE